MAMAGSRDSFVPICCILRAVDILDSRRIYCRV